MRDKGILKTICLSSGFIAFCYVLIRSIRVGVTYDEAYTISEFVHLPVLEIINYSKVVANNHILNTLLIKLFFSFGNDSLFVARLPNVLAFIMYLYFAYRLVSRNLSDYTGIGCFLLLILNPFLLDFFGLARGYGLSLGFMLGALYFAIEHVQQFKVSYVVKSIGLGGLSVVSNFSMLNFFIILVFILNLLPLLKKDRIVFKKTCINSFVFLFILLIVLYEPIRKLRAAGALFYGGNRNFYSDTLVSLTKYSLYSPDSTGWVYFSLNIFLVILCSAILISFFYNKKLYSIKNIFVAITGLCILSVVLQYYLLGTLYLIDRTALFFYPLLIFCLCFSINDFSKYVQRAVLPVIIGSFLMNAVLHFNLYKTVLWSFDAHSAEILYLINERGKQENKKMQIDFSWPLKSSVNYYIRSGNYPFIENSKDEIEYDVVNADADYYIFLSNSLENTGYVGATHNIHTFQKNVFISYPREHLIVFEQIYPKK